MIDKDFTFIQAPRRLRSILRSVGLDLQSPGFQAAAAGWAIERILTRWLESVSPGHEAIGSGANIEKLARGLREVGQINLEQYHKLKDVRETRNQGAHGRWDSVSTEHAEVVVKTAEEFAILATAYNSSLTEIGNIETAMDIVYSLREEQPRHSRLVGWAFNQGRLLNGGRKAFYLKVITYSLLALWGASSLIGTAYVIGYSLPAVMGQGSRLAVFVTAMSVISGLCALYVVVMYVASQLTRPVATAFKRGAAPANRSWTADNPIGVVLVCDSHVDKTPIRMQRYEATCPLCAAPITIDYGGHAFKHKVVGRCTAVKEEHVFSFDHRSRTGKLLTG